MTDADADALMERLTLKAAEGCCMDDTYHGAPCQYHEGFYDGAEAFWRALQVDEGVDWSEDDESQLRLARFVAANEADE